MGSALMSRLSVLTILFMVLLSSCQTQRPFDELSIGVILPLSGDYAALGQEFQRGIDLALGELNNNGFAMKVIYEDDQSFSPTAAANAAHKLVDIDSVDVGMTMVIEQAKPVGPIFSENHIPLLVMWDSNRHIQEAGELVFSNGFSTEKAGETMADFAYNSLNIRRMALVSHIEPWAEIVSESFRQRFESLGGTVVVDEKTQADELDYRIILQKIKNSGAQGIYFPLIPMSNVNFLTQMQELGIHLPLFTGDVLIQDAIAAAGDAAEGVYLTNVYADDTKRLSVLYLEKYGSESLDPNLVSFGYEGIQILKEAQDSGLALGSFLESYFGTDRSADRIERIYQVRNGAPVLIETP